MSQRNPITAQGLEKVKAELKHIITVERPQNIRDIEEALSHGDLKENAEYHSAKEKQGMIDARFQHLNGVIANAEVIDVSATQSDKVLFGATVTYEDMDTGDESVWQIVGQDEADVKAKTISIQSPIAKALLGKKEGDSVIINIPKGQIEVEILSVEYK